MHAPGYRPHRDAEQFLCQVVTPSESYKGEAQYLFLAPPFGEGSQSLWVTPPSWALLLPLALWVIGPHHRSPRIERKLITPTNQEHNPTALAD